METIKTSYDLAVEAVSLLSYEEQDRLFDFFGRKDTRNNSQSISKEVANVRFAKG